MFGKQKYKKIETIPTETAVEEVVQHVPVASRPLPRAEVQQADVVAKAAAEEDAPAEPSHHEILDIIEGNQLRVLQMIRYLRGRL